MNQPQLGSFESIPLSAIRPSGTNPRKNFDQVALDELTRSVSEMGVTQPLLLRPIAAENPSSTRWAVVDRGTFVRYVVPTKAGTEQIGEVEWKTESRGSVERVFDEGTEEENQAEAEAFAAERNHPISDSYEIVSGERRYRAAMAAEQSSVPAIVRALTDAEALDIQMIENLQRADLHPVEEAEGFRVLMANGATAEDVAKKSGKTVSHVQKIVKLLQLEIDAKQLFLDGHLSLGHALLLARLTPKEQLRALLHLMNIRDWEYEKKTPSEKIALRVVSYTGTSAFGGDTRGRLINPTEAQLKTWIQSNVLLQLAGVPWDLGDAELLPVAGPCTTCPKRTGANAALFQDLTTAEDTCTDPACFAEKQVLFTKRVQRIAAEQGTPLLKISAKPSNEKLEQKPVIVEHGHTTVVAKKAVKQGQWLPSAENACPATVAAVAVDGADQGKTSFVCADQNCKVHKHTVTKLTAASGGGNPRESYEEQRKRQEEDAKAEDEVRRRMLAEVRDGLEFSGTDFLQMFLVEVLDDLNVQEARLCERLGVPFTAPKSASQDTWDGNRRRNEAAAPALAAHLNELRAEDLHEVAFAILAMRAEDIGGYIGEDDEMKLAHRLVKRAGFDPKASEKDARKQIEAEKLGIAVPVQAVAQSRPAKKAAAVRKSKPQVDGKSAAAGAAAEQAGA